MKDAEILKNLKDFKDIEPDEKWYHVNRTILFNIIEKDSSSNKKSFNAKTMFFSIFVFARNVIPTWKVALSGFLGVAVIGGTVFGAGSSLPGDGLYPVKIGIEKVELALVADDVKATNIRLKHIDNRIEELNKLSQEKKSPKNINTVAKNIESNISSVQSTLKTIEKDENVNQEDLIQLVKLVDEKTVNATKALNDLDKNNKTVTEIAKKSYDLGQQALKIIISQGSEEQQKIVSDSLNAKIQLQEAVANDVVGKLTEIKNFTSTTQTIINTEISTSTDPKIEFNMEQIEKIDPAQITEYLELAKQYQEKGDYKSALVEIEKARFYSDLYKDVLDEASLNISIDKIEDSLKEIESTSTSSTLK